MYTASYRKTSRLTVQYHYQLHIQGMAQCGSRHNNMKSIKNSFEFMKIILEHHVNLGTSYLYTQSPLCMN